VYTLWYIRQRGADGFLRWALDSFNADPLNSTDHRLFAAGDIYMIYPDVKDAENPTAHTSVRFEKLAEGVRDIAKFNWLLENYPAYEKSLTRALENIGGDLHTTVTKAQDAVNDAGRRAAVAELIKTAEASKHATNEAVIVSVSAARRVLEQSSPSDEELTEVAYTLAQILRALSEADGSDTEAPTNPAESDSSESDPPTTNVPDKTPGGNGSTETPANPTETDTPAKKGCRSALGLGAVTVAATAAAVLKKKKEE
jgi:hypothetical protein